MKISITANTSWYLFNFRRNTISRLVNDGYEVIAISPDSDYKLELESLGCRFVPVRMQRKGKNPLYDLRTIYDFYSIFKREKIDLTLNFTPKNNIYATLAARILKVKVINNIAGLGAIFIKNTLFSKLVSFLYKYSQRNADFVFFQNEEDQNLFLKKGIVSAEKCDRLPGSGVDLTRFTYSKLEEKKEIRFLLVSRLIAEKGVYLYAEAASILRKKYLHLEFCILGPLDTNSSSAVKQREIESWENQGAIHYLGFTDSVESELLKSDCIVLPSYYREGVPKSLLEAAAIGRSIVTTRNVGCKEVVDDGFNGFLCEPKSLSSLVDALEKFINLSAEEKTEMGRNSRSKVEKDFDEELVISKYDNIIKRVIKSK